jgi:Immunity protein 42
MTHENEFGDRSKFSIAFDLDQNHGGLYLFGRFCYWIGGIQVGDYGSGTSLRDVLMFLRGIVCDNGQREHSELFKLPAKDLFKRIDRALYGAGSEYTNLADIEGWARFQINPPVDIFDLWKVYLVENNSESRVVFASTNEEIAEINLPSGDFDKVIPEAYNALFEIYELESKQ